MSDDETAMVPIMKYGAIFEVSDQLDDVTVGIFRSVAVADWRGMVEREGYQPVDAEPTVTLLRRAIPEYFELDGEMHKMPDRAWRITGRVLPADVPLPPGGVPNPLPVVFPTASDPCGGNTKGGEGCTCDPPFGRTT